MIVTLLTDFGTRDYFVGAMKGALLSVNPEALIVDITHEVAPHDVEEAAFTLLAAFETFPEGTVHVAVVDPGVGSTRRAIVVESEAQLFVGPDNGIFGHVYERLARFRVFHAVEERFFRVSASTTFSKSPNVISKRPQKNRPGCGLGGASSCGRKSPARTIGPATS